MRKLWLVVVLVGCAKSAPKESAPPAGTRDNEATPSSTATATEQQPPLAQAPAPTGAAPGDVDRAAGAGAPPSDDKLKGNAAKEHARASGVLGPTDQDAFKPLEPFVAKIESGPIGSLEKDVQACYDKALAKQAGLVGTLELKLTHKADGSIANVAIAKSTLKHAELEQCVIDLVKSAKLEVAKADVKTKAKIAFKKQP